jgi:hypothetical protein
MADRLRVSVLGTTAATLMFAYFYVPVFLGRTSEAMNERYGSDRESVWAWTFGMRWLRSWARDIERATGGRMSARAALWWLVAFPIGLPRLQLALNRTPALPPARVISI